MDRGAWRATVYTVAKSQTGLSTNAKKNLSVGDYFKKLRILEAVVVAQENRV